MLLSNFQHLLPDVIFTAAETLGGRCTGRFLALNAMENRVYSIEMEGRENVVIKFYRPGRWSRETIQAEHDFLKLAYNNEIPVVCPLPDTAGRTLFETEGIYFAIFPKRPGRLEPELNKEQLQFLGRFLGRLHNVGSSVLDAPRKRLDPETYGRESLEYIAQERLLSPGLGPTYEKLVNDICTLVTPLFKDASYLLLHGDCHSGNILWRNEQPYFIDFDDMLYAPAVQDLWMLTGGDDAEARKNREILIQSYEEFRAFDTSTLQLIEPLRALRMIYFSAWIARRREDGAFKHVFPHFGTEKYWEEQVEGLSLQLERIREVTGG